jgi:hypothetical protein
LGAWIAVLLVCAWIATRALHSGDDLVREAWEPIQGGVGVPIVIDATDASGAPSRLLVGPACTEAPAAVQDGAEPTSLPRHIELRHVLRVGPVSWARGRTLIYVRSPTLESQRPRRGDVYVPIENAMADLRRDVDAGWEAFERRRDRARRNLESIHRFDMEQEGRSPAPQVETQEVR